MQERFKILILFEDHDLGLAQLSDIPVGFQDEAPAVGLEQSPAARHEHVPPVFRAMVNLAGPFSGLFQFGLDRAEGRGQPALQQTIAAVPPTLGSELTAESPS